MRRALSLARKGRGAVSPNPMVGCILVSGGKIVGEAWHRRFGGPHAEALALRAAGDKARGATAYVTLEPCCGHPGKKTPPCAPALISAGVRRVVAATRDANPAVSGRGLKMLKAAGIKTEIGVLKKEAEALNRAFFTRMRLNRPYVILKAALSLDGKSAATSGRSQWITGAGARKTVHRLRAETDAVLVGVGTVIADNPALTAHGAGKDPVRVVLDTKLRTPPRSRLLDGKAPTLIFTASRGTLPGAEVIRVPSSQGRTSLKAVLGVLAKKGIGSVLVEGGPRIHASFLKEKFVDEARIFISPKLLSGAADPNCAPRLAKPRVGRIGEDFVFSGKVKL